MDISVDMAPGEDNKKDEFEAVTTEVNAEGTAPEGINSGMSLSDNMVPVSEKMLLTEHPAGAQHEGESIQSASGSCEDVNKGMEYYQVPAIAIED